MATDVPQPPSATRQSTVGSIRKALRMRLGKNFFVAMTMLAPFFLVFLLFKVIPIIVALYFSFTEYDAISAPQWIGLANYKELISHVSAESRLFWQSVINSLYFAFGQVSLEMIIGLFLATLVNLPLRGRNLFRLAFYMPVVTSTVAVSMIWMWIYNPHAGLLNHILSYVGVPAQDWLQSTSLAMPSVIAVGVWHGMGWSMVVYLAGLQGIPRELYEAAKIDGANAWKSFRYITLPGLRPVTLFIVVVSSIAALQVFTEVHVMTQGGPLNTTTTVTHQIWKNAFQFYRMGFASALAFILFIITAVISIINAKVFNREIHN